MGAALDQRPMRRSHIVCLDQGGLWGQEATLAEVSSGARFPPFSRRRRRPMGAFPGARALRTHHQRDQAADLTQDCGRLLAPRDQRTTSWQSRMDAASPSGRVLTNTESKGCWVRDGERMRQRGAVYHFACRAFFMVQRIPRDRVFERRAALYNRPKLRRLATPCFPTIRESCSAIFMMLSARSTCWLKLTSASDGVGSPEGWL